MRTPEQTEKIIIALEEEYPQAVCSLTEVDPWRLLVQVRLAAQCTDERVNQVTPELFERYPDCFAMAQAAPEDVEPIIHSCGFFRSKARDIVWCAQELALREGRVPDTLEKLVALPGVGRKSANLILGDVYHMPGAVVVDTHCIRLSNRMGFVDGEKDPKRIELALREILPPEKSSDFCHRIVLHGRAVCQARRPRCEVCCCAPYCRTFCGE